MGIAFKAVLVGAAISLAALVSAKVHVNPSHALAFSELVLVSRQDGGEAGRIEKLRDATRRMAEAGTRPALIDG